MQFIFEKVTDYNLIAPAIKIINSQNRNIISTSKLINDLKLISIIPEDEKSILKNRSDDKFSQKIRNLISHKVLEKYNLAKSSNNQIELTNHGKRLGKFIDNKLYQKDLIEIRNLVIDNDFIENLLMAKLNINFNPFLFQKLDSCDFSVRALKLIKNAGFKYIGDLITNVDQNYLLKFPNSGQKTILEIENFLSKKNLKFGMRSSWNSITNIEILAKEYLKHQVKNISHNIDDIILNYIKRDPKETESKFQRKKLILEKRFALFGKFSTLESIGAEFDITRERIRQIQKSFAAKIKKKEDINFAIKKLINFISKQTPILEETLSELLIKENFFNTVKDIPSLRNIISSFDKFKFDNFLLNNSSFKRENISDKNENKSQFLQEFLVSSKKEEKILNSIVVHSRKWTTKNSFCNFEKLISDLFKTRNFSKFLNIKNSLKKHDNFLWFDDNNFIALDTAGQTILTKLKRLLFIQRKITFEDFMSALLNDNRVGTSPPKEILQKICKINNLNFDQDYIYYSGESMQIPELEKKIIKLFTENGDFLTFWECINLSEKYEIADGSLGYMIYGSYLVKQLDNKVFCLFGTELNQEKIISANERSNREKTKNTNLNIEINWTIEKKVLMTFKLTKSIQMRGYIYIGSTWDKILKGSYYSYDLKEDIKVSHAVWDLKEILRSFNVGNTVKLEFSFEPYKTIKITQA